MSLTSFVDDREIRDHILEIAPKPSPEHKRWTVAPVLTEQPQLLGTAFDYLLRFGLESRHPDTSDGAWVAEKAPQALWERLLGEDDQTLEVLREAGLEPPDADLLLREALERARESHRRFLRDGELTDALLEAVLDLGRLDSLIRPGPVDINLGAHPDRSLADLRNLFEAVPWDVFERYDRAWLNPSFGSGSELVSGADADLIVDDTLVDIKTWEQPSLRADVWAQLVGYALVNEFSRHETGLPRTEHVGVYWSRQGYLWTHPLDLLRDDDRAREAVDWLEREAAKRFGGRGEATGLREPDALRAALAQVLEGEARSATAWVPGDAGVRASIGGDAGSITIEVVGAEGRPVDEDLSADQLATLRGMGFGWPDDERSGMAQQFSTANVDGPQIADLVTNLLLDVLGAQPGDVRLRPRVDGGLPPGR